MNEIKFKVDDVFHSIIKHAKEAPCCHIAYSEEHTKEPALYLVKDSGIYLMSAGHPGQDRTDGKKGRVVAYAQGFEPDAEDSWERCREAVGGDDFAVDLPVRYFTDMITAGATVVVLSVNSRGRISFSYTK